MKIKMMVAAAALVGSVSAFGAVEFSITQNLLNSKSTSTKVGDADAVTAKSMTSTPFDMEVAVSWDSFVLYVYPTTGGSFGLGYSLNDSLEVGLNLGLASSDNGEDAPTKSTSKTQDIGLYGIYYLAAGPGNLEISGSVDTSSGSTTSGTTTTDTKGTEIGLGVLYEHKIAGEFYYVGSVSYSQNTEKSGSTETKITSTDINLLGIRVNF